MTNQEYLNRFLEQSAEYLGLQSGTAAVDCAVLTADEHIPVGMFQHHAHAHESTKFINGDRI